VDPDGKLSVRTRRETHYIPKWEGDPDSLNGCTQYGEAKIVREIFEKIAYEGFTLRQLCKYLNDRYGPPGRSKSWSPIYVSRIIQNPVYKGDFIANRYLIVSTREVTKNGDILTHKKSTERNPDEWIHIQVPPIVNPELWHMANEISSRNKVMAARNSKRTYLLTGLIKCEECTYAINAETLGHKKKPLVYYVCTTAKLGYPKDWRRNYATCTQRTRIRADVIETVVWGIVKDIIANPDILLQRLDEQFASQHNQEIRNQREYLLKKKEKLDIHDAKNRALVDNETYTPEEYKEMRAEYKEQVSAINQELKALEDEYVTEESIAEKKAHIIDLCNKARTRRLDDNAPMELKKLIIKQVVSRIILNIREQKLTIIGEIGRETYSIPEQMEAFVLQWVS
jgi:site-specific DNA recombinase